MPKAVPHMDNFEPIAIVGRACVLPGALSPEALFAAVKACRVLIDEAPAGAWGLDSRRLLRPTASGSEFAASNRGGYVTGFDTVFDPTAFADRIDDPERLDPLVQWLLHCTSVALAEAGVDVPPPGSGLIVGNLSYPTVEHTRFVEDHWLKLGGQSPSAVLAGRDSDPRNRFSSGFPVHVVANAFGLSGDAFALDAACASSLYAIEIACRRLQNHEADLMLAGGVARAEPLFIHLGFTALQALSPTGQSRPFHKGADGLLPAEGAGLVALKRLDDAVRDGDHIFGVIRGVGLSNDGRQSGFLAPSADGQVRAMSNAYAQAGLSPADVGLIECHATGTSRGDTVELESLARVWGDYAKPVVGSLKANIGHPVTASGVASLLKVLSSFEAKTLPPTPCDDPLDVISEYGFRVLSEPEPWETDGPRRAAISNFGFGGNNAHMIVEEWTGAAPIRTQDSGPAAVATPAEPIAICAIGVIAGESVGLTSFVGRLVAAREAQDTRTPEIVLKMAGLGFPPKDLEASLAQQTSILAVVEEALGQIGPVDAASTGVYIGMSVDPQAARHGLRVRLPELLDTQTPTDGWRVANAESAPVLTAAHVIGCMPNIPANRVHSQRDWTAPGFTVASEELSGIDALGLAVRALQAGHISSALVGASDFSHESAHKAAAARVLPEDRQRPGDAAVAMVLMRERDARAQGVQVLATVGVPTSGVVPVGAEGEAVAVQISLTPSAGESEVTARFGHAHAASGLLHVAAGAVTAHLGVTLDRAGAWPAPRRQDGVHSQVAVTSFSGRGASVLLAAPNQTVDSISALMTPVCRFYAAKDRAALAEAVTSDVQMLQGEVRLALVAKTEQELERLRTHSLAELDQGRSPTGPGLYFGEGTVEGEVAFCYTGAAAAYPGAARDLLLAFPGIGHSLAAKFAGTPDLAERLYGADVTSFSPATQLTGSSFVCQAHTEFTRGVLGIQPQVAMGLSSGETNSLLAFGVWSDLDAMLEDIEGSEMYANQLTGACHAAAQYWGLPEGEDPNWVCWRIAAPLAEIEAAMDGESRVYITVIHHYEDVVIGGDAEACGRVVDAVGRRRAISLGLDMVVHCAPLEPFAKHWNDIHTRETRSVPEIRFYTNAGNRAYVPTREAAADAITQQALEPIDLPKTVEQAYADGVRVFIEHGPRALLTSAIGRTLEGRPHIVVAVDPHEGAGLEPLARSVAALWTAGIPMDLTQYADRMAGLRVGALGAAVVSGPMLRLRTHSPDIVWPQGTTLTSTTAVSMESNAPSSAQQAMSPPPSGGLGYDLSGLFASNGSTARPVSSAAGSGTATPAGAPVGAPASAPAIAATGAPSGPAVAMPAPGQGSADAHPAMALLNSVAQTHMDFLRRQKELHDQFLSVTLGNAAAGSYTAPTLAPSTHVHPGSGTVVGAGSAHVGAEVVPAAGGGAISAHVAAPSVGTPAFGTDSVPAPAVATPAVAATAVDPLAVVNPALIVPVAAPQGPTFLTREQLEIHAGGKISEIFGALFEQQDGYARQVRMPEPPLLLADRAILIEGEPGSMAKGRVVTETDVRADEWYLHAGRMAPGAVIESGQADLLLISWLGADFLNKGDRVYRLLGCDLTFHGDLPAAGDTLRYDIHVDGHAKTGDVRLFFFHYDCHIGDRLLITVRNGQAGFFTEEELATSGGVLWDAAEDEPKADARLDPAPCLTKKRNFSAEDVQHFVNGDAYRCFGEGFEMAACHTRTPSIGSGRLQLLDAVPEFDPTGGPWGRGYLRAVADVPVDTWFYDGHFKNDPCMPGTLMADAATQALSFAMAAMGFSIYRDGWRFEPMPGEMARFLCRGQVVPDGPHSLEYEVFIEEVIDGDVPEVYAALLCKSDGFKVFGCRRFGMRLVPDYPLTTRRELLAGAEPARLVGPAGSDVRGDYEALLACAWGKPSDAFGEMFTKYDGPLSCPRLPGPPYHFVSSIVSVDVPPGSAQAGVMASNFDVDPEAWYFDEGQGEMPFAVLLEALLQPCGWFASYLNFFVETPGDVAFRNLDGDDCVLSRPVHPGTGTLRMTTQLTHHVEAAGTSIVFFKVTCESDEGPVMHLTTSFGFFSPEILKDQRGLATTDEMRARRDEVSPTAALPLEDGGGVLAHLPGMDGPKMRMLDAVTGFWPDAGKDGLGRIRTTQAIRPDAWYFQAHFFGDPVQPGSLGLEGLMQSARALMSLKGWLDDLVDPVFDQPVIGIPVSWRYRGQVVPLRENIVTEVEAVSVDIVPGESVTLMVYGTQWVDGLRIYEMPSFAVRARARGT